MIVRRSAAEIEKLRKSGLLVYQILQDLKLLVVEGATTNDLEIAAEKMIADAGAKPAFKGYYSHASGTKYPYVLCTSVNEEVVHGMPSAKRKLKHGDIVSIDTGVLLNGYFGPMCDGVTAHGGEVLKFIGDALLAIFPIADDPKQACEAALAAAGTGRRHAR